MDAVDFKRQLYSHESYPSLNAFTDELTNLGVEHRALKLTWKELMEYGTPSLLHYRDKIPRFVIATRVTETEITYYKSNLTKCTEKREDFVKYWNGVTLYVVEPSIFSWKCFLKEAYVKYRNGLLLAIITLLVMLFLHTNLLEGNVFLFGLFFLKFVGFCFSILLLRHDWGRESTLEKHFCSLTKSFSCNAVLSSKASMLFGWIKMSDIGAIYFGGSLIILFLSLVKEMDREIEILGLLSFCSFPYILFSLSYQYFKIKRWCPLCLGVLLVLILEIVMNVLYFSAVGIKFPPLNSLLMTVFLILGGAIFGDVLKSWLKAYLMSEEKEIRYLALKRNRTIFVATLDRQPALEMSFSEKDILLGNRSARTMVTLAINPFCTPCLDLYGQLRDLQNRYPDNFCLNIRFMSINEEVEIGLSLISLYYQSKGLFIEAFDVWKEDKDFVMFQKRFGKIHFSDIARQELSKHLAWKKQIHLYHTPAVFLDNKKLPDIYTYEDLFYFLRYK